MYTAIHGQQVTEAASQSTFVKHHQVCELIHLKVSYRLNVVIIRLIPLSPLMHLLVASLGRNSWMKETHVILISQMLLKQSLLVVDLCSAAPHKLTSN